MWFLVFSDSLNIVYRADNNVHTRIIASNVIYAQQTLERTVYRNVFLSIINGRIMAIAVAGTRLQAVFIVLSFSNMSSQRVWVLLVNSRTMGVITFLHASELK